jgi:hypothetical protein
MPSLIDAFGNDLAIERVTVLGRTVDIPGVSARGLAYLLGRFPDLRKLMSGRRVEEQELLAMGGEVVGAIIAAGTGSPADERAEAFAASLPLDAQADLLSAIMKVTMPKGVGPFVEKLAGLGLLAGGPSNTEPATKSPKQSRNSSTPAKTSASLESAPLAN